MDRNCRWLVLVAALVAAFSTARSARSAEVERLDGAWIAKSYLYDGKSLPKEWVELYRYTFKGDTLLIRGLMHDESERECGLAIDPIKKPKQIDIKFPGFNHAAQGIYELQDGQLTICIRNAESKQGRPTELTSKPDSELSVIVLKKQ